MKTHLPLPTREFSGGEFSLVIALAFGMSLVASLSMAFNYQGRPIVFNEQGLIFTVAYEIFFGAVIGVVLRARQWRWNDFAVHFSPGTTALGLVLGIGMIAASAAFEAIVGKVPTAVTASPGWIAAVSVVNPWFEELFVLGYVVQSMRKRFGLVTAMNVSLAIRIAYHLYQGPGGVIPIAVYALVATILYVRLGRLWPVIVMHGLLDFVPLMMANGEAG